MTTLDSLTLASIPPEDEALRAPLFAFLTGVMNGCGDDFAGDGAGGVGLSGTALLAMNADVYVM